TSDRGQDHPFAERGTDLDQDQSGSRRSVSADLAFAPMQASRAVASVTLSKMLREERSAYKEEKMRQLAQAGREKAREDGHQVGGNRRDSAGYLKTATPLVE
ncbi:unnamed protein product, partial [Amoebophrya sp. A120]